VLHIVQNIIPLFISFFIGVFIRKRRILTQEEGKKILKLIFYFTLPASVFLSVNQITLSLEYVYLPVIAVITFLILTGISYMVFRLYKKSPQKFGVLVVGSIIMNIAFIYPYASAGYGDSGFTKVVFFDLGNISMTFSLAYWIACKYGLGETSNLHIIKKVLQSPPLWALAIGLLVNMLSIPIPHFMNLSLKFLAQMTFPMIMICLGIIFSLQISFDHLLIKVLLLRFIGGFIMGYLLVTLFGITGETRIIILLCCSAPVGMNTIIFATLAELDTEIAAHLVSLGIGLGMIFTTALMLLAGS